MLLVSFMGLAQKRALTHADYDGWKSLGGQTLTKDGNYLMYMISPQEGDNMVTVMHTSKDQKWAYPRLSRASFTFDDKWLVATIKPEADTVRMLKLKKTKADGMPKDSLLILNLANWEAQKIARVKSFKTPEKGGDWLAYLLEKPVPEKKKKDEADSTKKEEAKPVKTDGSQLVLKNLNTGVEHKFESVSDYYFSEKGNMLYYVKATENTLKNAAIIAFDTKAGKATTVDQGKTEYKRLAMNEAGNQLAFLATADSAKAKKKYYSLHHFDAKSGKTNELAAMKTAGIPEGWMVSDNASPRFAKNDNRIFFGTAPDYKTYAYEDDTTILNEERVSLDIWGWKDTDIQPMQLRNKNRELNKSWMAVYDIKNKKVIQIADEKVENINLDRDAAFDFAIGSDDSKYRWEYSWNIQTGADYYMVDLNTGAKSMIFENLKGRPALSPAGKYLYWFDPMDSAWHAYDIAAKIKLNLTKGIDANFYQELHDSPSYPGSYGITGWTENDEAILINDNFDIWKVELRKKMAPVNLTNGFGRKNDIRFRRVNLDREERFVSLKDPMYLSAFHLYTKQDGFYTLANGQLNKLVMDDASFSSLAKAENADKWIVRKSTYQDNELYMTDAKLSSMKKLTETNPQQKDVNWGTVELVEWEAMDGTPLQGLLFKPENFDPNKKYPMMVYFYERLSDGLHSYRSPAPSASTINIPYFVSNEYLVFVPDIKYEIGFAGKSAYDCIVPGVLSLTKRPYVDKENMAIQGQSWGGYQVAYLVTKTNLFKAAGAGAPVANMTSAYGGIRWGTGMSRMFQYEQTQSRVGGTLWEKPMHYIENSPLFFIDNVTTPVLIMHNDEDGAVPWYQGIEFYMALRRNAVPSWLLVYNGEDHNLVQRKNRKDLSIRLSQFFDYYLKGAPAPKWMMEGLPAVEKGRTLKYELMEE